MRTLLALMVTGIVLLSSCSTGNGTRDDYFGYAPKKENKIEREEVNTQEQVPPETVYVYTDYAAPVQPENYSYNVYPSIYVDPWNMYGGIGFYAGAYPFYFGINVGFPIYYPNWAYAPYYPYWGNGYGCDYYPPYDWCWGYDDYYGDGYYDDDYYDDTWRDDPRDFGPSRGKGDTDYNNGDWKPNRRSTKPAIAREAGPVKHTVNDDVSPVKGPNMNTDYAAKKKGLDKPVSPSDVSGPVADQVKANPKYVLPPDDFVSKNKQSKDVNRIDKDIKGFASKNVTGNNSNQNDGDRAKAGSENKGQNSGGHVIDKPVRKTEIKNIEPVSVANTREYRRDNSLKEIPKVNFKAPEQSKSIKNSSSSESADFFGSLAKAISSVAGSGGDNNSSGSKGYSSSKSDNSSSSSSNRGSSGNSSGKSSSGGFNRGKR